MNGMSPQVNYLLNATLNASIEIEGALRSIPNLPSALRAETFDPFNVDARGLADQSVGEEEAEESREEGEDEAVEFVEGDTMDIEDSEL